MPSSRRFGFVVVGAIAAIAIVAGVVFAGGHLFDPAGARRNDIGERLVTWGGNAAVGDSIALADLTDFSWDRVMLGGPYSGNDQAQEQLGFFGTSRRHRAIGTRA